jgi:hypothetical protein
MTGKPIKTIHGTNTTVSMNVRWYNGSTDSAGPNNERNKVMDGKMTTQIFRVIIHFIFVFIGCGPSRV